MKIHEAVSEAENGEVLLEARRQKFQDFLDGRLLELAEVEL